MKKKRLLTGLIVLLLLFLIVTVTLFGKQVNCMLGGGMWSYLPSGCVDSCLEGEYLGCTAVMTWGCDCGSQKCWNGKNCQPG
ncbi:MAG: hypothetical protein WAX07_00220 [Candidatus Altiarchaeia archaeon]